MTINNKGQAAAVDLMLICICVSVFAIVIWTASMGGKAPESHALRARQDYAKSMMVSALYSTPENGDPRYQAKSISDLLCMHSTKPDEMPYEVLIAKMKEAKIGEAISEKAVGSEAEWFIYAGPVLCLHGRSGSDEVEECTADQTVYAKESTAATAELVVPSGGTGGAHGTGPRFVKVPLFLGIKWS